MPSLSVLGGKAPHPKVDDGWKIKEGTSSKKMFAVGNFQEEAHPRNHSNYPAPRTFYV
jgi:hypothetical protein